MHKVFLILRTLRYVKLIQIYYQLWYRIKNRFLKLSWYTAYDSNKIYNLEVQLHHDLIVHTQKYLGKNRFRFLNLEYDFDTAINWNFQEHGKLWNYNLQYFDYLHDATISIEERIFLLENFSTQMLSGTIFPEPYPVSLRVINTILFRSQHNIVNETIDKALLRQINYLENNLEYHLLANHLLENIFTLYIASFAIKNKKLFNKANDSLKEQLTEQILADGAHYECTPMYHSIILSKLLLCIEIADKNNFFDATSETYKEVASSMLGWINAYSFPDGSWALMNDATLDIAPTTPILNTTANKLGIHPIEITMHQSGFRKLSATNWEAIIDVGNIMPAYQPGHAHADIFNFCLWYNGKQVIVDTGISTYNNNKQRSYERSTAAHNTITIQSTNQSEVWSAFRVGKRARVNVLEECNNYVRAEHDGYKKMYNIIHERAYKASEDKIEITDKLLGALDNISATSNILFDDSIITKKELSNHTIYTFNSGIHITLPVTTKQLPVTIYNGYNKAKQGQQLQVAVSTSSTLTISFT